MTVRVGLVGAGAMGEAHLQTLSREVHGARVVAIADTDTQRASALVEKLGLAEVAFVDDPHRLVRMPHVDAVLIASPDETHHDLVMTCLDTATPVLREKPLATTADGCRQIVDHESEGGRRLVQLGYMRRFDPGYAAMKDTLDAGHHSRVRILPAHHAARGGRDARPHHDRARDKLGRRGRHRGIRQCPLRL